MQTDWILAHIEHRVLTLTLNRPDVRNALSTDCLELLVDHLEQADKDPQIGAIVIAGNPRFLRLVLTLKSSSNKPLRRRSRIGALKFGAVFRKFPNPLSPQSMVMHWVLALN